MKTLLEIFGEAALVGAAGWYVSYALLWFYEQRRLVGLNSAEQRAAHRYIGCVALVVGLIAAIVFAMTR